MIGVLTLGCAEYIASPEQAARDVRAIRLNTPQVTVDEGESAQLLATVMDQLGNPFDALPVGVSVQWSTSDVAIASVNGFGMLTGHQAGAAVVAAEASGRFGRVTVTAPVTVRPQVTGIEVLAGDDQTGTVGEPLAQPLRARVVNRLGAGVPGVAVDFAVVLGAGTLSAPNAVTDSNGSAEVSWTLGTQAGANAVDAQTARLPATTVRFGAQAVAGPIQTLTAVGGGGQAAPAGSTLAQSLEVLAADRFANPVSGVQVDWAATTGGGTIAPPAGPTDAAGRASAQWTLGPSDGEQRAAASVAGLLTASFTAMAIAPVASVVVAPATASVLEGGSITLTATALDARGDVLLGRTVVWTSSDPTMATVVNGVLSALAPGSVTVTATVEGVSGTASVTVIPVLVASVTVAPASVTLTVAGQQTFAATARDVAGNVLLGRPVTWSSSDLALATMDGGGVLTALAAGTVTVTATVQSVSGTASVTITDTPAPVATVEVTPSPVTLPSGSSQQLVATPKDATGNPLPGRTASWSTSAAAVADVDATGLVSAGLAGTATITATVEGVIGAAGVTVVAGPASPATSIVSVSAPTVPVGDVVTLTLTAKDAAGNGVTSGGLVIVFEPSGGTSAGTAGPTTDLGNGTYTATFTGVTAGSPLTIGATIGGTPVGTTLPTLQVTPPVPASIAVSSGDGQTALAGSQLPIAPAVIVTDGAGNAVSGVAVQFTIGSGGGEVSVPNQVTNIDGIATVGSWTLGPAAGQQTLTATAAGAGISGNPVTFTAVALTAAPGSATLSLGQGFSCRINGGAVTQCWGTNAIGQLGDGTSTQRTLPVSVTGGLSFVALAAGLTHTCALTANGAAYCWGDNAHGEFGNGTTSSSNAPVPAGGGLVFNQLTAGANYTCGLVPGGAAYCWGNNGRGNLGDGTTTPRLTPTPVLGGLTFTSIAAGGDNHTCALTSAGDAYCWGYNFDGELGDGTFTDRLTPTPVTGGLTFSQIQSNIFHTCALTPAGAAFCWGDNNVRQLGDGTTVDQPTPRPVVGGHTFTTLGTGATCALDANGSAWCWGFNPNGEVGDGTTNIALAPVPVAGNHVFAVIAAGYGQTCARTLPGNTWCWGLGTSGQLGDGTLNSHLTPIEVGVLAPTQLAFVAQPGNGRAGVTLPAILVAVQDVTGATVTTSSAVITLELDQNPTDANLLGTLSVAAVNGIATFANLRVDLAGQGYTLRAFSETLTDAVSVPFDIAPPRMVLDIAGSDVVGVGSTVAVDIALERPAPAGGVTVTVTSDNPGNVTVVAPGTAFIKAGDRSGQVTVNGESVGGTTIRATAPGFENASLFVSTTNQIISLPTTLNVPYGQTVSIPIQLGVPAPPGGLDVTLVSSDPSHVGIVTPTVHLNAGVQLGSGTVSGVLPGSAIVTATAPSWATDNSTVNTTANLSIVAPTTTLNATFGIAMTVELRSNGAGAAAPSPGVTVTLTPANPQCAVATTPVTIPTGQVNVPFNLTYGGTATLPCTTTITATAPNIASAVVTVTVQPAPVITLSAPPRIGRGLQQPVSLFLGASNYGSTTVHVESNTPSVALVSPADTTPGTAAFDATMTAPVTSRTYYIQGVEGAPVPTNVTITVSAPGFTAASVVVPIVQGAVGLTGPSTTMTSLSPNQDFQVRIGPINATGNGLSGEQVIRAGGVALQAEVENTVASVAQLVTRDSTRQRVATPILIRQQRSVFGLAQGGVQFQPLAAGQTKVKPSITGFVAVESVTVNVTAPNMTLSAGQRIGRGLQQPTSVFLGASDYGTATVRIESENPSKLLVAADATTPGTAFIDLPMTAPVTSRTFYVQAVESADTTTDSVRVFASTPRFVPDTVKWVVVQSAVGMAGPSATTTTLALNSDFQVRIGPINAAKNALAGEQVIRAGWDSAHVVVANRTPVVGQLVTKDSVAQTVSTIIQVGLARSPSGLPSRGLQFDPLEAGSTRLVPGITNFATVESVTVNITAPAVTLSGGQRIGRGLQQPSSVFLGASNYGTATIRVESSNPTRLLVAPDATTPGTAFIDLPMTAPVTSRTFYVQAVESADTTTDSVVVSAGASRFTPATVKWAVVQSAVGMAGPSATTTTLSPNGDFQVRIGPINATKNALNGEQSIRAGGAAVNAVVTNSTALLAQLVTRDSIRQTVSTPIVIGQARTVSGLASGGLQFDPLSSGTTRIKPSITNFATVESVTVVISTPAITMSSGPRLGRGLQAPTSFFLGANSYGSVTVHVESSDPTKVLVAPDATTPGTASIDVLMTAPTTSRTYYLQGVEGATVPATVTVTASAPGFTDGTQSVTLAQAAVGLVGPSTNIAASAANVDFQVRIGPINAANNGLAGEQPIRAGGTAVTATVTSSNVSVGQLVTNATTGPSVTTPFVIGDQRSHTFANGGVRFDPLTAGQTTITPSIPGFATVEPVTVNVTGTASVLSLGAAAKPAPARGARPPEQ